MPTHLGVVGKPAYVCPAPAVMLLRRSAVQCPFVSLVSTAIMTCACCGAMMPTCCPVFSFHVAQVLLRLVSIYSMRFHFHAALMTAICRRVRFHSSPRGCCV